MARAFPLFALAAASALATGCAQTASQGQPLTASRNPSLYSVHQPVVQRSDFVLDLAAPDGLAATEAGRLGAWLDGLGLGYGDRVWVDPGLSYGSRAREDVASVVGSYGLLLSESAPVTAGPVPPGAVRVIVSRMSASVPTCPNWSASLSANSTTATHSNYGCATNSNLAAMIADPADLVLGQAGSPSSDPSETTRAVEAYRKRVLTGAGGIKSEAGEKK